MLFRSGLTVKFRSDGGGLGAKAGSATKDLGIGGPGSGTRMDIPGSASQLGGFANGPGGLLSGRNGPGGFSDHGPGGPGDLALTGSLKGHAAANVKVSAPQDPVSQTSIDDQAILTVIRQHLNEIRHCYEQTLQRAPNMAGKMKIGFTIGLTGRVTEINVLQSDIDDVLMRSCVTGKVQRWPFPEPRGTTPVHVTYPFIFNPL